MSKPCPSASESSRIALAGEIGEQGRGSHGGAAGGGILGSARWFPDETSAPAGRTAIPSAAHRGCRNRRRSRRRRAICEQIAAALRHRPPQRVACGQLRHQKRQADRDDPRRMPIGPDIGRGQRNTGRGLLGAEFRRFAERLRRGQLRADGLAALAQDLDRHEAGAFLELAAASGALPPAWPARRRCRHWDDPRTGISLVTVKIRTCASWAAIARRQHEGGLDVIELDGDGLHLRGREPAGIQHHRERIAAEGDDP